VLILNEIAFFLLLFIFFSQTNHIQIDSLLGALFQYSGFCTESKRVVNAPTPTSKHICGWNILSNSQVFIMSWAWPFCFVNFGRSFHDYGVWSGFMHL
jgi:hypothetical protein